MEAFFSRFKTENRSLPLDCQTLEELTVVIAGRIDYYNRDRRHSKIGYVAPLDYAGSSALEKPRMSRKGFEQTAQKGDTLIWYFHR